LESEKKYKIELGTLEDKTKEFRFEDTPSFFEHLDLIGFVGASFVAHVTLSKSENMLQLALEMTGKLRLICDRSLEEYEQPFTSTDKLILKFSDHSEELDNGLRLIPRGLQVLDLQQDLYDMLCLAVPMKKLHPRFENESYDNPEGKVVYSTQKPSDEASSTETESRWAALKNLKFDN
jgi:uncharacterized protein